MDTFAPDELDQVLALISSADLSTTAGAAALKADLDEHFPNGGDFAEPIRARALAGTLTDKGSGTLLFGRHFGADDSPYAISCDAVVMSGRGPDSAHHVHTKGEVCVTVALEGEPTFDGHPLGWVVYPEGHEHTPDVQGGRMAMLYFWPGGRAKFTKR